MTETFEALTVAVVAVLPGALYVWGFEQQVGRWGATAADRVLRFIGWSALLHAAFAPVTLRLWVVYVRPGRVSRGDLPLWLWVHMTDAKDMREPSSGDEVKGGYPAGGEVVFTIEDLGPPPDGPGPGVVADPTSAPVPPSADGEQPSE